MIARCLRYSRLDFSRLRCLTSNPRTKTDPEGCLVVLEGRAPFSNRFFDSSTSNSTGRTTEFQIVFRQFPAPAFRYYTIPSHGKQPYDRLRGIFRYAYVKMQLSRSDFADFFSFIFFFTSVCFVLRFI